ncbi:MAG: hypothetical protein LBT05_10990 [Planctomycetaceae bacterium]|jgi:hypothetical protein|nr:hypothetical protein [Planctomycetaceae bacterium]
MNDHFLENLTRRKFIRKVGGGLVSVTIVDFLLGGPQLALHAEREQQVPRAVVPRTIQMKTVVFQMTLIIIVDRNPKIALI